MSKRATVVMIVALALPALSQSVSADTGITYLGAFRAFTGNPSVYNGNLAYYPSGNGGAGSLFISRGASPSTIYEITIPALVNTTSLGAEHGHHASLVSGEHHAAGVGLAKRR